MNRVNLDLPNLKESIRKSRLRSESRITRIDSDAETVRNGVCVDTVTGTLKTLASNKCDFILFVGRGDSCCLGNPYGFPTQILCEKKIWKHRTANVYFRCFS